MVPYGMQQGRMSRPVVRGWLALILAVVSLWCGRESWAEQTTSSQAAGRRPNILVIMADEHNAGVLGCYGNKIVRTPNLDGLAAHGIRFGSAYTNSPLCVPSRLSFTAGKYVSRCGAWSNSAWLPTDEYPSLPNLLNAAGYESLLCGKMHYDATRRYGFQEIGFKSNQNFQTGLLNRRAPDDLEGKPGYSKRFDAFGVGEGPIMRHDRQVTQGTVDFLNGRKKTDKPFFLIAGYHAPHFPLNVPEEYVAPYRGKVPMPNVPAGTTESLPRNYKHLRVGFHVENVPDKVVRESRELYYGLTQWLDGEVGQVLSALRSSEAAEDTVVIYTADHGEDLGEHGMWFKNCMFESGARVPLIISWPKRWKGGESRSGACSLVDVVQTIAELGGTKAPADWNGHSLVPCMDHPAVPMRDLAVSEYYAHHIASGFAMLRSGDYKYVYHTAPDAQHPAERELYNLALDPGELRNLAGDAGEKSRIEKMHAMLVKELGEDPEATERRCRAEISKGYGREHPKGRGGRKANAEDAD